MPSGEVIRITAVKDYVNFPHKPEITLSSAPMPGGLGTKIGELEGEEVTNEEGRKRGVQYTKDAGVILCRPWECWKMLSWTLTHQSALLLSEQCN